MTGASGGDTGDIDLRSAFERTTMDVPGIIHLTREIWCCLRRRGNTVRKEVVALASPLYAHNRPPSPSLRPQHHHQHQQQHQQVFPLPVLVCTRVQPETETMPPMSSCSEQQQQQQHHRLSSAGGVATAAQPPPLVCGSWCDDRPPGSWPTARPPGEKGTPSPADVTVDRDASAAAVCGCAGDGGADDGDLPSSSSTPAASTPVRSPPTRSSRVAPATAKGLLERRGSNASLTLDLSSQTSESPTMGSPPRESSVEEFLLSASHRLTRRELVDFLHNTSAIYEEFWKIPMNHPDKIEVPGSGIKNRYRTIIPNEASRVRLLCSGSVDDPASSYINANYIRGYGGEPRAYIATQGPMANTVSDFWAMIWQERSPAIIMITKLTEQSRIKCECYMPESSAIYGAVHVTVDSQLELGGLIVRHLTLQSTSDDGKMRPLRTVHYWYTTWPDHRAPHSAANQLMAIINQVELQRNDPSTGKSRGPVVVHCSAGIGRTGCFIATSIALQQLRVERVVDILAIVCGMRLDRGGMVQTNEQYEFVHRAVDMFDQDELPTPFAERRTQ